MKSEELNSLLDRYLAEQASEEEVKLVEEWYQSFETNAGLTQHLSKSELEKSMAKGFNSIRNTLKL